MQLVRVGLTALFLYAGVALQAVADTVALEQAIATDRASLSVAYEVQHADYTVSQAYELLSPFRDVMVATDEAQGTFVLLLDTDQRAAVRRMGFTVVPADAYKSQRRLELDQALSDAQRDRAMAPRSSSTTGSALAPAALPPPTLPSQPGATLDEQPCFSTVEETIATAQGLVAQYPNLASLIDIGDSWQKVNALGGYDLWVMKITNTAITEPKPKLFIHSAMHAREWATAPLTLAFAQELLNGYGADADLSWIVDYHEVHILFFMNPDGRKIAEQRVLKRKNNNTNHCTNGTQVLSGFGVDLNRNFGFTWAWGEADHDYGPRYRVSNEACNETYRGPTPASEPETVAVENYVRTLFPDLRGPNDTDPAPLNTQGMHIDVHAHGQLILYPWSHTDELAPNETGMATLARKLAFFNRYNPQPTEALYFLDGNSESVSYGELGIPQLTFEIGTQFFETCSPFDSKIKPDNLESLRYAAKVVRAPYTLPYGPDVTEIQPFGDRFGRVNLNDLVTLSATANDNRYQSYRRRNETVEIINGVETTTVTFDTVNEPFEQVIAAEYTIDTPPWEPGTINYPLAAEDLTYDTETEVVQADMLIAGLAPGQHRLYYRAQDANGQWGAVSAQHFTVNEPLQARFDTVCAGNECQLFGDASLHFDGSIASYHWDLGGGATSDEMNPTHIFPGLGRYPVTLTVADSQGRQASHTGVVEPWFIGQVPAAAFTVSCSLLQCQFNGGGSSAGVTFEWRLSNGDVLAGEVIDYTFASAGNYTIELVVTGGTALKGVAAQAVTVSATAAPAQSGSSSGGGGGAFGFFLLMLLFAVRKRRFSSVIIS